MSSRRKFILAICITGSVFCASGFALAQERSYKYDQILIDIRINKDTTVDIEEIQTYNFTGEYHQGWRSVSLQKIDTISDIEVIDAQANQPFKYSPTRLEKTSPSSWGKYAYKKENGAVNIEWYYNANSEVKSWIIKYKVHGAIGFFKNYDELYWNLFSGYDVPVEKVTATVRLPEPVSKDLMEINNYFGTHESSDAAAIPDKGGNIEKIVYSINKVSPDNPMTVYVSWPKGIVNQNAYWVDFFKIYLGYILSFLIVIATIVITFARWYLTEKYEKGRGVIIPRYEPPQNLPPAMAEFIIKEKISSKTWPATIVDLAVRGQLKISEDSAPDSWFKIVNFFKKILPIAIGLPICIILLVTTSFEYESVDIQAVSRWVVFLLLAGFFIWISVKSLKSEKDYIISRTNTRQDVENLYEYEKKFLDAMTGNKTDNITLAGGVLSTKELKKAKNFSRAETLMLSLKQVEEDLLKDLSTINELYEASPDKEKNKGKFAVAIFFLILLPFGLGFADYFLNAAILPVVTIILSGAWLYFYFKYETRLSSAGFEKREEWLGFKLYLETAEKYRLQNLTPETFEKYLPYAMIFGVEKKWAKAFECMNMQNPSWYAAPGIHSGSFESSATAFSASAFSASLSSSFASAFSGASSGGGGGGGGSAGGGGGGGGGGAS